MLTIERMWKRRACTCGVVIAGAALLFVAGLLYAMAGANLTLPNVKVGQDFADVSPELDYPTYLAPDDETSGVRLRYEYGRYTLQPIYLYITVSTSQTLTSVQYQDTSDW